MLAIVNDISALLVIAVVIYRMGQTDHWIYPLLAIIWLTLFLTFPGTLGLICAIVACAFVAQAFVVRRWMFADGSEPMQCENAGPTTDKISHLPRDVHRVRVDVEPSHRDRLRQPDTGAAIAAMLKRGRT
jgi:hypothetical protein